MPDYKISLEDKFGSLRLIDVGAEAAAVGDEWVNQTLTTVNDSVVRLGVVEGQFHWHKHDGEDEFFLVLDGELEIEVEGGDTFARRLGREAACTLGGGFLGRAEPPAASLGAILSRWPRRRSCASS
jgi:hypothetical protein